MNLFLIRKYSNCIYKLFYR